MKIRLREHMSWEVMQIAVEMARLLGFASETATFPVTSFVSGEEVPETLAGLEAYRPLLPTAQVPADYCASSKDVRAEVDFDWRRKKGMETIFSRGRFLKDCNLDGLPDKMDFVIVLPRDSSIYALAAACDLAFRFGMETTAYDGVLLTDHEPDGNAVVFVDSTTCSVNWEEKEAGTRVVVAGNGPELQELVSQFCQTFPMLDSFHTWREYLQGAIDSFTMRNLDGQMAFAAAYGQSGDILYGSPADGKEICAVNRALPGIQYKNHKDGETIYRKSYAPPWEADIFRTALSRACQDLHPGDEVEIYAALSESKEVRCGLAEDAAAMILAVGARPKKVQLLCAYKQGYSWLEEVILPKLANMDVSSIQISFKPFMPEGVTEWQDEDGAVPSYTNTGKNPDHWYDLPIRFLQELYPIEDRLAQELGIPRENITFTIYDGEEDITYVVSAVDDTGRVLLADSYRVHWSERPYLDEYPDMGKVHPDTGYLQVAVNGVCSFEQRIPTDLEAIWDIFQADILPDCRRFMESKTAGNPTAELQPFFSRLKIEVFASEPEYRLQSREDLFSTLDGLHEDLYFAATDYFKKYGLKHAGTAFDAPGLILPVIHVRDGRAPAVTVELADLQTDTPQLRRGEAIIARAGSRYEAQAYVSSVTCGRRGLRVFVTVEGVAPEIVKAYTAFLEQGLLDASERLAGIEQIVFRADDFTFATALPVQENMRKDVSITDIDIPETEVIGYENYLEMIDQLRRVPGLQVYETARSYAGRRIYAVEVIPEHEGYMSRTKRLTRYPSVYINARHHANEVSSTNATLLLIKKLLTEETGLARRLNLVILPMENVDGTAIHYALQLDNPNWKLHVARFNHLGNEFAHEYFHTDTIHTEAMAFTRIFERFLPDIIVDDHGVPSHEWDQQFSGYTSPAYKGFWLPRSLLYGYFWYITEDSYRSNYALNKKLENAIADAVGADEEIAAWNKEWAARFEKFAHGWLPKLFPADYYKGMINYWIGWPYRPGFYYTACGFPWITSVSYTSEVADETAQGDYLALCARTHLTHDLATLKLFASARCVYEQNWQIGDDGIEVKCVRLRPVIAE